MTIRILPPRNAPECVCLQLTAQLQTSQLDLRGRKVRAKWIKWVTGKGVEREGGWGRKGKAEEGK